MEMALSGAAAVMEDKQVEVFAGSPTDPMSNFSQSLKSLNLTNVYDADRIALDAAKEDFKQARIKAIEAFSNDSLDTCDRIQAMAIRVAATMLENVDHPKDALGVCISCLEELHSLPEVKESFSLEIYKGYKYPFYKEHRRQIFTSVCRMNHAIRNAAVMIAKEVELLTLPLIDNGKEKIDPLQDHRVADILRGLEMPHYSVTPLTLGKMDDKNMPKIPQGIAADSQGHFIVGDECDRSVKIFDRDGNFQYNLGSLPMDDEKAMASIGDVATDGEDSVYVLVELQQRLGTTRFKICVFDKQGSMNHDFFLREETAEVLRVTVNNYKDVLVLADSSEKEKRSVVEVYESDGHFKRSFGEKTLHCAENICVTSDGRVIVLDNEDDQGTMSLEVFRSDGEFLFQKLVENVEKSITELRSSIACRQVGNYVVVAVPSAISRNEKADPVQILKYDMNDGKFLPRIVLPLKGLVSTRGIAVSVEGRIAIGLLDKSEGNSKVLVV